MQKCVTCQFYDRNHAKAATGTVAQSKQGQCRRMAPLLHPMNSKSYMIEGVWPTVQDDDWCGEWKLVARRADARTNEMSVGGAMNGLQASVPHVARIGASVAAEPGRAAYVGTVFTPPVKSLLPHTSAAGAVLPIAAAATAATTVTHAGDD